jgi:hypothetical protein
MKVLVVLRYGQLEASMNMAGDPYVQDRMIYKVVHPAMWV